MSNFAQIKCAIFVYLYISDTNVLYIIVHLRRTNTEPKDIIIFTCCLLTKSSDSSLCHSKLKRNIVTTYHSIILYKFSKHNMKYAAVRRAEN